MSLASLLLLSLLLLMADANTDPALYLGWAEKYEYTLVTTGIICLCSVLHFAISLLFNNDPKGPYMMGMSYDMVVLPKRVLISV